MKTHAIRSASGMYRWKPCPGSINLITKLIADGLVDPYRTNEYATLGQGAHELGDRCLRTGVQASSFIGSFMCTEAVPVEVTPEMADAVQVYIDLVRSVSVEKGDTLYFIETTFDLSPIYPGLFGTTDCAAYHLPTRTLYVFDYKHGEGKAVEARGNLQLRYYGLGALLKLQSLKLPHPMPEEVELTIVQPRAHHADGPIRFERMKSAHLLMWIDDLVAAAEATEKPDAPLHAGDHCHFCPAAARCPELHKEALAMAQATFSPVSEKPQLTPVNQLSDDQMRRALLAAEVIEPWLKELHAHAQELLQRGGVIDGWKLVQKRAMRSWLMDDIVTGPELMKLGLKHDDIYSEPELLSPAQIEKKLPRAKHDELKRLVQKVSSGVTLVSADDPRPAVLTAIPFKDLTQGATP
jgi:hypothetical protein